MEEHHFHGRRRRPLILQFLGNFFAGLGSAVATAFDQIQEKRLDHFSPFLKLAQFTCNICSSISRNKAFVTISAL